MKSMALQGLRTLLVPTLYLIVVHGTAFAATAAGTTFGPASSSQSTSFTTRALMTNFLGNPPDPITMSPCPPGAVDTPDAVCGHFEMQINSTGCCRRASASRRATPA